ncbi:5-formyltetrahydrofolate cyclo-ligase [Rhodothermus bifroesti]
METIAAQRKAALRERFRAFRMNLSAEAHQACSQAMVHHLMQLPELLQAQTVMLYWPLLERREIDLRPLAFWLWERGVQVALPVVVSTATGTPMLEARRFQTIAQLATGPWGLQEPYNTPRVPPETLDVVLVPALGAGRNGYRLGYGKGYYDAFLRGLAACTICPVYAACLVDFVPPEAHDVPIRILVTEHEILRLP